MTGRGARSYIAHDGCDIEPHEERVTVDWGGADEVEQGRGGARSSQQARSRGTAWSRGSR